MRPLVCRLLGAKCRLELGQRIGADQRCTDLVCKLRKWLVLLEIHQVRNEMEVQRAQVLVLNITSECVASTEYAPHGTHVASEFVLARTL